MKIHAYDSEGNILQGLLNTNCIGPNYRKWRGSSLPHHDEFLVDYSPDQTGSWFLIRWSHTPEISGSKECDDEFDDNSNALRRSPEQAVRWLRDNGHEPPSDLVEQAKPAGDGDSNGQATASSKPLSPQQAEVWNLLEGNILSGKEIAIKLHNDYTKGGAVRQLIMAIRSTGREITTVPAQGYFRPDSPPNFD